MSEELPDERGVPHPLMRKHAHRGCALLGGVVMPHWKRALLGGVVMPHWGRALLMGFGLHRVTPFIIRGARIP